MKLVLEYDDWGPTHPLAITGFEYLEKIKDHFPEFKVTMFTIPMDIRFKRPSHLTHDEFKTILAAYQKAYEDGWMRFALHGLTHLPMEFEELGYEEAKKRIIVGERIFQEAELPLEKIFKAPNWAISKEAKEAAEDLGYTVVEDLYYDWNLKDDRPGAKDNDVIIAHGHVQNGSMLINGKEDGCYNGIEETMPKLMDLPTDTQWLFLTPEMCK